MFGRSHSFDYSSTFTLHNHNLLQKVAIFNCHCGYTEWNFRPCLCTWWIMNLWFESVIYVAKLVQGTLVWYVGPPINLQLITLLCFNEYGMPHTFRWQIYDHELLWGRISNSFVPCIPCHSIPWLSWHIRSLLTFNIVAITYPQLSLFDVPISMLYLCDTLVDAYM